MHSLYYSTIVGISLFLSFSSSLSLSLPSLWLSLLFSSLLFSSLLFSSLLFSSLSLSLPLSLSLSLSLYPSLSLFKLHSFKILLLQLAFANFVMFQRFPISRATCYRLKSWLVSVGAIENWKLKPKPHLLCVWMQDLCVCALSFRAIIFEIWIRLYWFPDPISALSVDFGLWILLPALCLTKWFRISFSEKKRRKMPSSSFILYPICCNAAPLSPLPFLFFFSLLSHPLLRFYSPFPSLLESPPA